MTKRPGRRSQAARGAAALARRGRGSPERPERRAPAREVRATGEAPVRDAWEPTRPPTAAPQEGASLLTLSSGGQSPAAAGAAQGGQIPETQVPPRPWARGRAAGGPIRNRHHGASLTERRLRKGPSSTADMLPRARAAEGPEGSGRPAAGSPWAPPSGERQGSPPEASAPRPERVAASEPAGTPDPVPVPMHFQSWAFRGTGETRRPHPELGGGSRRRLHRASACPCTASADPTLPRGGRGGRPPPTGGPLDQGRGHPAGKNTPAPHMRVWPVLYCPTFKKLSHTRRESDVAKSRRGS